MSVMKALDTKEISYARMEPISRGITAVFEWENDGGDWEEIVRVEYFIQ